MTLRRTHCNRHRRRAPRSRRGSQLCRRRCYSSSPSSSSRREPMPRAIPMTEAPYRDQRALFAAFLATQTIDGSSFEVGERKSAGHFFFESDKRTIYRKAVRSLKHLCSYRPKDEPSTETSGLFRAIKNPGLFSQVGNVFVVAGAGFEPTTSGL